MLTGLQSVVESAAAGGAEAVVVGMAHRGRLNVLNNVFGKPLGLIATEMRGESRSSFNVGDVRYHLGTRTVTDVEVELGTDSSSYVLGGNAGNAGLDDDGVKTVTLKEQRRVEMSMAPNPSHLEAVNSVVAGMVPVEADEGGRVARGGRSRVSQRKVMGLLIHGDAAFCGLGVNAEVMQLQDLPDYTTGGSSTSSSTTRSGSPRCRGERDRARTRATSPKGTGLRFFTSTATTPKPSSARVDSPPTFAPSGAR